MLDAGHLLVHRAPGRWFALAELASINLRPSFLAASLLADPLGFLHAVQREYA
ncbi:hypothetical protein [Variovorax sp. DXTD-1]|uniref:hypothetical protein n=1 Tax=Variovorax sp. DXTD-1 TaxID=2495592 RepID=UPI0021AF41B6|nr:hypothetical protein [Variovorax sp. DXTD-1]